MREPCSVIVAGKRDSRRHRTTSFSENRDLPIRQRLRFLRGEIDSASLNTISRLSQVAQLLKRREFIVELNRFQTEMADFIALPFLSSKKLKIWSFHVVVVQ